MILAVQNFKTSNFKTNSVNCDAKSNTMNRIDNSKVIDDSFTKSNQIAFKGSLAKLGESVLGDAGTKLGGAVRKAGEGLLDKAGAKLTGLVRTGGEELSGAAETKLTGLVGTVGEELSEGAGTEIVGVTNKLGGETIEAVDVVPKVTDEAVGIIAEKAKTIVNERELPVTENPLIAAMARTTSFDDNTITLLDHLKSAGVDIRGVGSLRRCPGGGLHSYDKQLIKSELDSAFKNGDITQSQLSDLKHDVNMCGNLHNSAAEDAGGGYYTPDGDVSAHCIDTDAAYDADIDASGIDASGVDASDVDASDVDVSDVDVSGGGDDGGLVDGILGLLSGLFGGG